MQVPGREERRFAKEDIPSSLIRSMDGEQIRYPREFLEKAASRRLLGLRFGTQWGGRAAKWTGADEIMSLLIQHEFFKELFGKSEDTRNVEPDAMDEQGEEEKVYE
jgi:alkylation response protein AidB-like acyl-CoA dehydrogenase